MLTKLRRFYRRVFRPLRLPPAPGEPIGPVRGHLDTPIRGAESLALWRDPTVRALAEADDAPLPATADREGYHGDHHLEYWLTGLGDQQKAAAELGDRPGPRTIFEFGGATGRVLRHFRHGRPDDALLLSDVNPRAVAWVRRHLAGSIVPFLNTDHPPLPLPERSFDAVLAFSVFTHIDEMETAWLLELGRVVKPDGFLYLTVHNEDTWALLPQLPWLLGKWLETSPHLVRLLRGPMPEERMVFTYNNRAVDNCNVFVSSDYLRRSWGRLFGSVEIRPLAHQHQTVVVLRRPIL
jgi:SAM-dependent methyltransferase